MNFEELAWVRTPTSLNVIFEGRLVQLTRNSDRCKKIEALIKKGGQKEKIANELFPGKKIVNYSKGEFELKETGEIVESKTQKSLPKPIANKLADFIKEGLPSTAISKFWNNVKLNPNSYSVEQLFEFLSHNHFPITKDGCFLAYKYVDEVDGKLFDSYSRTYDNSVGKIVTMDRNKCNPDRKVTCSYGLHVASYDYANTSVSDENEKVLIEVKVNPKDVVSVPYDYNNQKIRVCRYEILRKTNTQSFENYAKLEKFKGQTIETKDTIDLKEKTAREIIDIVKEQTGELITFSLKNKKTIVKKAIKILEKQGLMYSF